MNSELKGTFLPLKVVKATFLPLKVGKVPFSQLGVHSGYFPDLAGLLAS